MRRASSQLDALEGLQVQDVVGDILDPASLIRAMEGCDWVFHVAAVSDYWRQGADWLYRVNVEGTENVLQAAAQVGVKRLVFTSSVAALGVPDDGEIMDESHTFNLPPHRFRYGHSKHLAEAKVQEAVQGGLDAVIVNPGVVLGARDLNRISGSIVIEVARGLIRFYLPGGLNYVAVEDVVAGHIGAAEHGRTGERYILGAENLTYREAIDTIVDVVGAGKPLFSFPLWAIEPAAVAVSLARQLFGNRIPINANQVRLSGLRIFVSPEKAIQELGMPQTPFRIAVERTYRWFKENDYL